MFETVCTYPLPSDLFAQAIHPSESLLSVGLASGHVQTFRLPALPSSPPASSDPDSSALSNGCGTIDTLWRTRRHKGSCRALTFSSDGEKIFSAGTDGIVKMAATETGQVESKVSIPSANITSNPDSPSLLHSISPTTVLLATDSAALHIYDLRIPSNPTIPSKPSQTYHPHDDYVSSLTPLPPSSSSTSGFPKQWVSTGGTTLAVTDVRRGVLVKSEDQEEELLSSVYVSGLPKRGTSVGEKVVVGGAGGVLTLWEKGVWDDQDERVYVAQGESIDVLCAVPENVGMTRHMLAAGLGDGRVRFVSVGSNKAVAEVRHDDMEGVVGLGFDAEGRMVSGGGQVVKVWQEEMVLDEDDSNDEDGDSVEVDESDNGALGGGAVGKRRRGDGEESAEREESDEEEKGKKGSKKRKKSRGRGRSGGKQNGISFKDLD